MDIEPIRIAIMHMLGIYVFILKVLQRYLFSENNNT